MPIMAMIRYGEDEMPLWNIPTNIIHSAWKPLNGGKADKIMAPKMQSVAVNGILDASPPISFMLLDPVWTTSMPATENKMHFPRI